MTRHAALSCATAALAAVLLSAPNALAEVPAVADRPLPEATRANSTLAVLLEDGGHGTFLELAERADLARVLDGEHAVTVFAPSDEAFETLPSWQMERLRRPEHVDELRELIGGHLIWGETRGEDVTGFVMRPTVAGFGVLLERAEDGERALTVAGVAVTEADRAASNGVVHRIDGLIRGSVAVATADDGLHHAPACENNPSHAASHGGTSRGSAGGNGGGGSGAGMARSGGSRGGSSGRGSAGPATPAAEPEMAGEPGGRPDTPPRGTPDRAPGGGRTGGGGGTGGGDGEVRGGGGVGGGTGGGGGCPCGGG